MATPNRRAGLKDVALRVGVSVNTASKALNSTRSNTHVAEDTRRRILEAARELGYQPNSAARSLVHGRADVVAIYLESGQSVDWPFVVEMIAGANHGCQEYSQSLLLYTRSRDQSAHEVCRSLLSGKADGVIVGQWTKPDIVTRLRESCLPTVHLPSAHPNLPSLIIDEAHGARRAIQYLVAKGHRRILYRHFSDFADHPSRLMSYQQAAAENDVQLTVVDAFDSNGNVGDNERRLLESPRDRRPTAAVCWNDEFAYRLILCCDGIGLRIPEDMAVVGFDGIRPLVPTGRQLTTVFVPWREMAHKAVGLLVDIRNGIQAPDETYFQLNVRTGDTA